MGRRFRCPSRRCGGVVMGSSYKAWTPEEVEMIMSDEYTDAYLADKFGRSKASIRCKRQHYLETIGVKPKRTNRQPRPKKGRVFRQWTQEQVLEILARNRPDKMLAAEWGLTTDIIKKKRFQLNNPEGSPAKPKPEIPFDLVDTEEL